MISEEEVDPKEAQRRYFISSNLTPPRFGMSVFNSFATAGIAGFQFLNQFQANPNQRLQETYDLLQQENQIEDQNSSTLMTIGRFVPKLLASGLGYMTNPITAGLMVGGEVLGGALATGGARLLPNVAGRQIGTKFLPETIGKATEVASKGAFGFAGMSIPDSAIQNYNRDTRSMNWGGFIADESANGAIGIGVSALGYAGGALWRQWFPKEKPPMPETKEAEVAIDKLNKKYEAGEIPKEEYEFYRDFLSDPHNPNLKERATTIMGKQGHSVNYANNSAHVELLPQEAIENLKTIIPQQLNDLLTDKTAFSDYVVGSELDKLRDSPEKINGLHGALSMMDHKLEFRDIKLKEADELLNQYLFKAVNENMPFSQKELFKFMKQASFESSHMSQLPVIIPENIKSNFQTIEKINKFKNKLKIEKRKGLEPNKQTLKRIKELEGNLKKILTPKEELAHLKDKLLDGGLKDNYQRMPEYQRLQDLANVWHNAQSLLDRIHLEDDYNKLYSQRDLTDAIVKSVDSNVEKFADQDRVVNALKEKMDHQYGLDTDNKILPAKQKAELKKELAKQENLSSPEERLSSYEEQVNEIGSEEDKEFFNQARNRLEQFKKNATVLADMINCLGSK